MTIVFWIIEGVLLLSFLFSVIKASYHWGRATAFREIADLYDEVTP